MQHAPVLNTELIESFRFASRAYLEKTFTLSSSGNAEDPKFIAEAGYRGNLLDILYDTFI